MHSSCDVYGVVHSLSDEFINHMCTVCCSRVHVYFSTSQSLLLTLLAGSMLALCHKLCLHYLKDHGAFGPFLPALRTPLYVIVAYRPL